MKRSIVTASLAAVAALALSGAPALSHDGHFSAGAPGDPKKPARTVLVKMLDDGKKMSFEPALVEVKRNEQVRFVLDNVGTYDHEFVLATVAENRKHAEEMKKNPEMEHDDPNAKRLSPFTKGELVWRFTKRGEFEFACLIPGHSEAGMVGKVIVK
ncbi:plastocyanin/azurin family copper-binding protein [Leptospira sp. severe_002]|uniref:cupredoxin domain-containing protein n=1 Tax=Leptospira sp. severe_002 TaxID=2838237 RepID=UPI001E5D94FD|nr:cupredoxin family protein [Leptospira sp. severe_002]